MKDVANENTVVRIPKWNVSKLKTRLSFSNISVYVATVILLFIVTCALFPTWIAPYAPTFMHADQILAAPSASHLFGTDYFGRDVFSLVVHGSRDSLIIGVSAVLIGGVVGGAIGALSGLCRWDC